MAAKYSDLSRGSLRDLLLAAPRIEMVQTELFGEVAIVVLPDGWSIDERADGLHLLDARGRDYGLMASRTIAARQAGAMSRMLSA